MPILVRLHFLSRFSYFGRYAACRVFYDKVEAMYLRCLD